MSRFLLLAQSRPRWIVGLCAALHVNGHHLDHKHCQCMHDPYLHQLQGVKRKIYVPFWERSKASYDSWQKRPPILGERVTMSHPPPVELRRSSTINEPTQFITSRPNQKNILKLSWPKQAISINLERQIEVQKWKP